MSDNTSITVAELAASLGCAVVGDGSRRVHSCNTLFDASPEQVSFLSNAKYSKHLETTRAGCVILLPGAGKAVKRAAGLDPLTVIEAKDTYYAWQQTVVKLHGYRKHPPVGISPLASIHPTAKVGANANIHPFAVIAENVTIGDNANIYPHVSIMGGSSVGNDCILYAGVRIYNDCTIGNRCILHAGATIGSDGYGYATNQGVHHKIPQTGNVAVEDDVEIGVNSVVERAVMETTIIGRGSKLGNGVVVGHNCHIGPGNLLVSQVGIAGSTNTGKYVVMGGQVGVAGHLNIPDMVRVAAQSGIMADPEANTEIGGTPAMEVSHARRVYLQFVQLPELAKRVKELERQLTRLQSPPS